MFGEHQGALVLRVIEWQQHTFLFSMILISTSLLAMATVMTVLVMVMMAVHGTCDYSDLLNRDGEYDDCSECDRNVIFLHDYDVGSFLA